jgi:hypothetical protein
VELTGKGTSLAAALILFGLGTAAWAAAEVKQKTFKIDMRKGFWETTTVMEGQKPKVDASCENDEDDELLAEETDPNSGCTTTRSLAGKTL